MIQVFSSFREYRTLKKWFLCAFLSISVLWMSVLPVNAIILYGGSPPDDDTSVTNTDTFILDDDDSVTNGPISIQFGSTLSETLLFDVTDGRFELSDDLSLEGGELKNFRIDNASAEPVACSPATTGQQYFDTTSNRMLFCDGVSSEYVVHSDNLSNVVFVDNTRPLKTGEVYATLSDAITYINTQTPNASNPWIIVLQPGTFSESVTIPFATTLLGYDSSKNTLTGTITLSNASSLKNVTVGSGGEVDIPSGSVGYIEYGDVSLDDGAGNGIDGTLMITRSFIDGVVSASGIVQAYDCVVGPTSFVNNGSIGTYQSTVLNFTNNNIWNNFGVAYDNTVLPSGSRLNAENTQEAIDELVQEGTPGSAWILDKDNVGAGSNVDLIANQGSDSDGILRYNSGLDYWELSNDGVNFDEIATFTRIDLDDAYNNFDTGPSTVTIDAAEGQTGGLTFSGSLATDETVTITNSGNGGGLLVENAGTGASLVVNDSTGDTTPFVIDETGEIGIGTSTPEVDLHIRDAASTVVNEWVLFDDGTNQVSILTGSQNPKITPTNADIGSFFLNSDTGAFYIKQDDGSSINWNLGGLTDNINDALQGTFGTPSGTNRFVTDTDPRLSATSGGFGETSLGTRLDYNDNKKITRSEIIFTRIFLPDESTVTSLGIFTTSAVTGNINFGIYSSNASGTAPVSLLAQTGIQVGVTSPVNAFWQFNLSGGPYLTTSADFYWLAVAVTAQPFTKARTSSDDLFIPFRLQSKGVGSATLPATPTLIGLGNTINLPYLGAFE